MTRTNHKRRSVSSDGTALLVSREIIGRFAEDIVTKFDPDKIVLFGSYAAGQPRADSDVDILVVMQASNELDQAYRVRMATEHPFPLDLIVRTPKSLQRRVEEGDCFLREILEQGQVLYEKAVR